jgi:hypothetical protein
MKIVRQTETELVVQDSSMWLSVVLAACALFPTYIAIAQHDHRAFRAAGALALFAIPWLRRATFTFDGATQTIRWRRLRYLWTRTGSSPFSDVRGIDIQSTMSGSNVTIYRLALDTPQATVPMSDVYSSGESRIVSVRDAIEGFLKLRPAGTPATPRSMKSDFDASVRSLVQEGRKIDAIQLLQSFEKLSLTEATQRVNAIDAHLHASG